MPAPSRHVLFQPLKVGRMQLGHRVVMAPMSRHRANINHAHEDTGVEYYSQRSSFPGTLLITEGVVISPQPGAYDYSPGIYTAEQIAGWRRITDAVHAKGSYIYLQLWALGRAVDPTYLAPNGECAIVSASAVRLEGRDTPRPLTVPEIQQYVREYAQAARNAIQAGFDGVEVHGANGYLIDQFLQDMTNERTDEYGGTIEKRSRFGLEVVKAVVDAVGQDRTGVRLTPWSTFQDMGMDDPIPQFSHFIRSLRDDFPDLSYLHLMEPPIENGVQRPGSNDVFREIWAPKPFLSANEHTPKSAFRISEQKGDLIAFGRWFISNPDLPRRLRDGIPLTPYNQKTFYGHGPDSIAGYTDYPFAEVYQEQHSRL